MQQVTYKEFKDFFLAKAFDVVGNGTYRKHLARCKDGGDQWAVDMSNSVQSMQTHIKDVASAIHSMPQTPNRLHEICKEVMVSAQPPIKLHAGCVTCCITEKQCMKCLDLSKTHKSSSCVYVDARFCYFFMLLWYCNKLEYIIRSFTRTWLDTRSEDDTFQDICKAIFQEMAPRIDSMHKLFVAAKNHILKTLEKYADAHRVTLILDPKK
jgi:hypothetical protein